jgi:hypothetical protein
MLAFVLLEPSAGKLACSVPRGLGAGNRAWLPSHPQAARTEPAIDCTEAFLARLFLRRYVTFCARRGRYAAMNGAAVLFAEVGAPAR